MIDREAVAKALAGHFGPAFDELALDKQEHRLLLRHGHVGVNQPTQADVLDAADAAIAAVLEQLREPSEAMLNAGQGILEDEDITRADGTIHVVDGDAGAVWQAMLEAAKPG